MANLLITIFLGWLGVHKFIQGKTKLGLLYMFTLGLFGIGWITDIVLAVVNLKKPTLTQTNTNSFYIAGIEYKTDDIIPLMRKNNPEYSKFVYRIKEDYVQLIPEPENPHDSNAIAIYMNNVKIGYVPAIMTSKIRPLIDTCDFIATIRGGDVRGKRGIIESNFVGEVRIER